VSSSVVVLVMVVLVDIVIGRYRIEYCGLGDVCDKKNRETQQEATHEVRITHGCWRVLQAAGHDGFASTYSRSEVET
jgi:hypothetical protein